MSSSSTKATAVSTNKEEGTIMSTVASIKNAVVSRVTVRSLAFVGVAALAISAAFGAGTSAHAEGFEFTPEWRAFVEQDAAMSAPDHNARALALSPEWTAHNETELRDGQARTAYVTAQPLKLSSEWSAQLEADAREMAGRPAYVTAQPFKLSPEWSAFVEAEALNGAVDRPFNAIGQ